MVDTKTHVLLVEDEAPLRLAIAEQLTDHGFEVAQAESGEQAVAALAEFAFDLVLTDLRLPRYRRRRRPRRGGGALSGDRRHRDDRLR